MMHADADFIMFSKNAVSGSRKLRNAILRSLGYSTPRRTRKPAVLVFHAAPQRRRGRPKGSPNKAVIDTARLDQTQVLVSTYCRVRIESLRGKKRHPRFSRARQIAMYVARQALDVSYPQIGRHFGRDHTTVMHACTKVQALIDAGDQPTIKAANHAFAGLAA